MSVSTFEELTKGKKPERSLLEPLKKSGGRNNLGRISIRHRGGGHKRMYRIIDWKREKLGVPARVVSIEYDPNRTARIALLLYADGEKRYIIAPVGLKEGARVSSGPEAELSLGNTLALKDIPTGTVIHNIELKPGRGGQLARGAGASAQLMAKDEKYAQVRMPSGEVRLDMGHLDVVVGDHCTGTTVIAPRCACLRINVLRCIWTRQGLVVPDPILPAAGAYPIERSARSIRLLERASVQWHAQNHSVRRHTVTGDVMVQCGGR